MDTTTTPEPLFWIQTAFAALAIVFALTASVIAWLSHNSRHWLSTTGVIVVSEVHQIPRKTKFFPRIKYEYQANRRTFRSRIIFIGHFIKTYSEAYSRGMVQNYPEGQKIKVYYNPTYPALSVLEPGINKGVISNLLEKMFICLFICVLLTPSFLKVLINWLSV